MHKDKYIVADATDCVDELSLFGCWRFWECEITIFYTITDSGEEWFIVDMGKPDGSINQFDKFITEDNTNGELASHFVMSVSHIDNSGNITTEDSNMYRVPINRIVVLK